MLREILSITLKRTTLWGKSLFHCLSRQLIKAKWCFNHNQKAELFNVITKKEELFKAMEKMQSPKPATRLALCQKAAWLKGEIPIKFNNFGNYKIVAYIGPINVYKAGLSGGRIW